MRNFAWQSALIFCSSLVLPLAYAVPPQAPVVSADPTHAPQLGGVAKGSCLDELFYAALPGKTNYCLGLREWKSGHFNDGLQLMKLAAGWGNKNAQYTLGLIYYGGHHVAPNPALGIAWLKLADQRHNDPQITMATRSAVKWASIDQRNQGEQLFQQMRARYGDKVAAARAWHHLGHWERSHGSDTGTLCLYGDQLYAVRHAGMQGLVAPTISRALQAARNMNKQTQEHPGIKRQVCIGISLQMQRHVVHKTAGTYFAGWMGTVNVGPLKQVPASAASSGH